MQFRYLMFDLWMLFINIDKNIDMFHVLSCTLKTNFKKSLEHLMRNARHTSIMGILAIKSNAKAAAISYYWPRDVYCKSMVKEMHQQRSVTKFDWYVGIYLV